MDKISVIVPVYNGVAKLRRCIESILNQTYSLIELILVDDGSTDGSESICDEYCEKYESVKVIHKHNEGVSSARNMGLANATGEYIGFVDCDDYIEERMYQTLLCEIYDSDLVMCGFYQNEMECAGVFDKRIVGREEAIVNITGNGKFKGYLWNKLFRKRIIDQNGIFFLTHVHMCEDLLFCVQYIDKIKTARLIPEILYHYEIDSANSASNGKFTPKKMSVIEAYNNLLIVDAVIRSNKIYNEIRWKKIRHCLSLWNELRKSNIEGKKRFLLAIKTEIKGSKLDFILAKEYGLKHKLSFLLLRTF